MAEPDPDFLNDLHVLARQHRREKRQRPAAASPAFLALLRLVLDAFETPEPGPKNARKKRPGKPRGRGKKG